LALASRFWGAPILKKMSDRPETVVNVQQINREPVFDAAIKQRLVKISRMIRQEALREERNASMAGKKLTPAFDLVRPKRPFGRFTTQKVYKQSKIGSAFQSCKSLIISNMHRESGRQNRKSPVIDYLHVFHYGRLAI
jgi:hypothetical protein